MLGRRQTMIEQSTFGFPFMVDKDHHISATGGDGAIRGKIIQVLFTAPGERVNRPDFGCGLINLVFDPNDTILAAATEFTIGQALTRFLGNEIIVDGLNVVAQEETMVVEVDYTQRKDQAKQAVRIQYR